MPIYEFTCPNNHEVEYVLGYDATRPEHCETCGEDLRRIYSPVAVNLKGPGFYKTDKRDGKYRQYQSDGVKNESRTKTT